MSKSARTPDTGRRQVGRLFRQFAALTALALAGTTLASAAALALTSSGLQPGTAAVDFYDGAIFWDRFDVPPPDGTLDGSPIQSGGPSWLELPADNTDSWTADGGYIVADQGVGKESTATVDVGTALNPPGDGEAEGNITVGSSQSGLGLALRLNAATGQKVAVVPQKNGTFHLIGVAAGEPTSFTVSGLASPYQLRARTLGSTLQVWVNGALVYTGAAIETGGSRYGLVAESTAPGWRVDNFVVRP